LRQICPKNKQKNKQPPFFPERTQPNYRMDIAIRTMAAPPTTLHTEEAHLIAACNRSERWAQQRLYEMHYGKLMAVSMRYANNQDDALDILHEGFIKIYSNLDKYQAGTALLAWMRRIVVNCAIDFYRKQIRTRTDDLDTAYHLHTDEADAISQCSEQDILDAIQQLSPAYRTAFNLYAIEGFSHKEIADTLGIAESTARANLVKARHKLQAILINKYPQINEI
jgi:RNA polymerase sigma factor (sigma-70 family)